MKLMRRILVEAAEELDAGTPPSAGYEALLTRTGSQITPTGEDIADETVRSTLTPGAPIPGAKQTDLALPLNWTGGGLKDGELQPPPFDVLLRASGLRRETGVVLILTSVSGSFSFGETLTADTATVGTVVDYDSERRTLYVNAVESAPTAGDTVSGESSAASATVSEVHDALVYRPQSAPEEQITATVRYYLDGIRHIVPYTRGSFALDFSANQTPLVNFTLSGLYQAPTDEPMPQASYRHMKLRPCFGAGISIEGANLEGLSVSAFAFDLANTLTPDDDIQAPEGRRGIDITERAPTGSIDPAVGALAALNPWADWASATERKIGVSITDPAKVPLGERSHVVVPRAVYQAPSYQDRNGRAAYALGYAATGRADDEAFLIFW